MDTIEQQERHAKWKILIEEQEKSGLSQTNFCKQKNLSSAQLGYYRSILKPKLPNEKISIGSFTPIKINQQTLEKDIRLNLPNGFQCSFPSTIDPAYLKKLIEVMLSC